ncbi:glutathione S-transferase family protein [Acidithiobacillus sp. MC6.1]|uniref:glutathione S-transferase family protein n=1 Tax=Acidithiobacillus caldus TaxID=33059 RepID=UPI0019D03FD4|nr:glutathione S-transferase family protein [Acidithiobacillus caldus]MBN6741941.1 glutathione S-transferase family protein [Acidithiobacillus sp. MC6.1]MBU2764424.1 glutathione S-transferase family protein [Acidithiobacillus caldus]
MEATIAQRQGKGQQGGPTLIHFEFCPFCHRVRLALGFKGIAHAEMIARFYGTEHFLAVSGYERLPVLLYSDGSRQSESLDIIRSLDTHFPDSASLTMAIDERDFEAVLAWRSRISDNLFRLISPILTAYDGLGDDPRAMAFYRQRMEGWLGASLEELHAQRRQFFDAMLPELEVMASTVDRYGFYRSPFSIADTVIAGDLTGLRLLDIPLPPALTAYFARVEAACATSLLPGCPRSASAAATNR